MPGMTSYGTETLGGFYPYLFLDLLIIAALIWLFWGANLLLSSRRTAHEQSGTVATVTPSTSVPTIPARVFLRRAIGIIWIIDGLLQAQPAMPGGFAQNIVGGVAQGQPHWLANLLHWEIYFWQAHPLDLSVATVLIQVGIGVGILAGGDTSLGRAALWISIVWGLSVWVGGEGLGGLLVSGSTQIMGAPGAVLVYVAAAASLLAPAQIWLDGRLFRWIRLGVAAVLLLGALLSAIPWEGFWTGSGLSAMFLAMAKVPQPGFLSAPVLWVAHLAQAHPILLNSALIAVMLGLGLGLISGRSPNRWIAAALVWLAITWWVGQDFGALGTKTATDPNISPLLAVMLVTVWIGTRRPVQPTTSDGASPAWAGLRRNLALASFVAMVVGSVPVMLGLPVAAAESCTIAALNTGGPVSSMNDRSLPDATLINQDGQAVDLRQWASKAVVITFLDPVCYDVCPIIGEQLATADRDLGPLAKNVEFVAIVANPIYRSISAVGAFDAELLLNRLPNWQYLTGSLAQLTRVWSDFSIEIELPRLEMVAHPTELFFVKPGDQEFSYTEDSALSNASVITSYAALIDQQLRAIAPG